MACGGGVRLGALMLAAVLLVECWATSSAPSITHHIVHLNTAGRPLQSAVLHSCSDTAIYVCKADRPAMGRKTVDAYGVRCHRSQINITLPNRGWAYRPTPEDETSLISTSSLGERVSLLDALFRAMKSWMKQSSWWKWLCDTGATVWFNVLPGSALFLIFSAIVLLL